MLPKGKHTLAGVENSQSSAMRASMPQALALEPHASAVASLAGMTTGRATCGGQALRPAAEKASMSICRV